VTLLAAGNDTSTATFFGGIVFTSITAPVLLVYLTQRERRADKREDWERQDAVAAKAEAAATAAATAATLILDANEKQARAIEEARAETNGRLDVIHTLVNSSMTAAIQAELDAITRELGMMHEIIALNTAAGRHPTAEVLGAIEATKLKIEELTKTLIDRAEQTRLAEQQQARPARRTTVRPVRKRASR
jgi:hypothetical protein